MDFHKYINDLLDGMSDYASLPMQATSSASPQPQPTASTSTSASSSSRTSIEKSLFEDYFNHNVEDNSTYDEFEAYIAFKITNVSGNGP